MSDNQKHLTVNFEHRLSYLSTTSQAGLTDSLVCMTDRALGVLHLLSMQFEDGGDEQVCNAVNATICELMDIKAFALAYADQDDLIEEGGVL